MPELSPLIVALDVPSLKDVERLVAKLGAQVKCYKVGLKLYTRYGPDVLGVLKKKRKQIFLDLKLHDIPNTVAEACVEATKHRVQLLTLHASGGREMMEAAARATQQEAGRLKISPPKLLGVTVLTSMDQTGLSETGVSRSPRAQVVKLAQLAHRAGLDGIVCSPQELATLQDKLPKKFLRVTPGIRPAGASLGDQKRVMTPKQAFDLGAHAIVVGRPILQAKDPSQVVEEILASR